MKDSSGKPARGSRRGKRVAVRLSRVDLDRLASGELKDIHQALRDPEPRTSSVVEQESSPSVSDSAKERWLKENIPPHW